MNKSFLFFAGIILFQLLLLINSRFTVWPEMVLYPWLQLHDFLPYKDIVNPYFPLLSAVLTNYFNITGVTIINLKIFTWGIILINDLLIYLIAKQISESKKKAFMSLIFFILGQIFYGGNGLWFELALTPLLLLSIYLIIDHKLNIIRLLLLGLIFGLAILTKQNSALFLLAFWVYFYIGSKQAFKNIVIFTTSVFLTVIFGLGVMIPPVAYKDFYFWAINLPLHFTAQHGFLLLPTKKQLLLILFPMTPLLFMEKTKQWIIWLMLMALSISFAFPRYEDFHLQVAVALSAILISLVNKKTAFLMVFIMFSLFFVNLTKTWQIPDRFIDRQMLTLADEIKNQGSSYLLNSPDLAYFFANKLPPKPWATNFPWYFENYNFESRFIAALYKQKIDMVVIGEKLGGDKYALGNYIPEELEKFIQENYKLSYKKDSFNYWKLK